jgi:hypothetical protein
MPHGHCTLTPDDAGRILDRLAGLEQVIPPEAVRQWKEVSSRRVKILARVTCRLILEPIRNLTDGSCLAKIYPSPEDRRADRDGIVVRVIRYTLNDPQRVGHGEVHTLITNLFDEDLYPAKELIMLYHERWEEELVFDEQKTHQDPRRATKPAQLRSETPAGVIQEIYALSLGHFVVRSLMFEAAATAGLDTDGLSFLGCLQILKCRLPECNSSSPGAFAEWYRGLLWEMQSERTILSTASFCGVSLCSAAGQARVPYLHIGKRLPLPCMAHRLVQRNLWNAIRCFPFAHVVSASTCGGVGITGQWSDVWARGRGGHEKGQ